MNDQDKTKQQLIEEMGELRRRVAALEASETQWRRTEEALKGSEERFRLLVEAIPQPIWRSDPNGNVIEFNRRWYEYTGQSTEEAEGSGWTKAVHPDEAAMVAGKVRAGITSGTPIEIINRLRRASDGSYRWHLARAIPMSDSCGKITGWIGSATDIDDQRRAEEALSRSEQRLFLHFQQTPLAAIEWDVEGRVTKWKPAAERIFGYPQAEALGRHFNSLVPQTAQEYVGHIADTLVAREGGNRSTNENVTKEGRIILCEWYNTPLIDAEGQFIGAASLAQDITEQKRAEDALRASEQQLRLALDASAAGTWSWDAQANEAVWDNRYHELYGLGSDHPRTHVTWLSCLHQDDRASVANRIEQVLNTPGDDVWSMEFRAISPTLGERWHLGLGYASRDLSGKVQRMTGIDIDITDRKRAEQALKMAHDQLEEKVEERTVQLRETNEQLQVEIEERRRATVALKQEHITLKHLLEASDHERQAISYEIHDGIAQFLFGAIMKLQTYEHQRDKNPGEAARAYDTAMELLQKSHGETRRLIASVRHPVLDEAGIVEAVAHFVNDLRKQGGPEIEFLNAVRSCRLAPALENAAYRICQEALTNACRHSHSERVQVTLLQKSDWLRIEVRDRGVGFEDTKTLSQNHYGLAGIRQRAKLLGGKCSIKSMPGKGTRIVVELPIVPRTTTEE